MIQAIREHARNVSLKTNFSQYYKMDPNVLSCTVQFFIMRILRLTTVEDLEMLKFGDFIYQRDERGHEYFRFSEKLINYLR